MIIRFAALLCLLIPQFGWCWSGPGHQIIADIAYTSSTVDTRHKAVELLKQLPSYDQDIGSKIPSGLSPEQTEEFIFDAAGPVPDYYRRRDHPLHDSANHTDWHYIDLPVVDETSPPQHIEADPQTTDPLHPSDCVGALQLNLDILKNGKSDAERAVALTWVMHLTGDMHQPLHCTALFSARYPNGDQGGNKFVVKDFTGKLKSLHGTWDGLFGEVTDFAKIQEIRDTITSNPANSREALATELSHKQVREWAEEGRALAKKSVYLLGSDHPLQGIRYDEYQGGMPVPELPEGYLKNSREVARQQAALAGYRLQDELEDALK